MSSVHGLEDGIHCLQWGTSAIDTNQLILDFSFTNFYIGVACSRPEYMFLVPFRALQIFLLCKNISSPRIFVLKSKNNTKDARMAFSTDDVGSERCAQY
jgi:hypothetical protein